MTDTTTPDLRDMGFFNDPDLDRAVGLIFELAAQVHVERQRRAALEQLLVDQKVISRDDLEALGQNSDFQNNIRQDLDQSLRQLMRVISERGDETGPLRAEVLDMD